MANKNSFHTSTSAGFSNDTIQAIRAAQATAGTPADPLGESSRLVQLPTQLEKLLSEQIASGTLKFVSEGEFLNQLLLGRYVLGDLTEVLKDRTSVTFRWKGRR